MEKKKSTRKHVPLLIVISTALIIIFMASAYAILNKTTTNMVTKYTDELAQHDMSTIQMFVSDRWDSLKSMHSEFRLKEYSDPSEIMEELGIKTIAKEFDYCLAVDDKGMLYSDTHNIFEKEQNPFLTYFKQEQDLFVTKFDDADKFLGTSQEFMLYGYNFSEEPIIISNAEVNIKFIGLVVLNDISKIRSRLRITCFDNRGYTSIINNVGDYIVKEDKFSADKQTQNLYQILEGRKIEGANIETIRNSIENSKNISFWWTSLDGERRYVNIYPIENFDWNFVVALDEDIFTSQTASFIRLLLAFLGMILVIISIIVFYIFRMSSNLKKMYASITANVYNRQFYEDKLNSKYVNALAIMDLDHLKIINDSFGHIAGDQAIKRVADAIAKRIGKRGEICRFGGDEFIVAFTDNLSSQEFNIILEDIRFAIENSQFTDFPDLRISTSIGGYYGSGVTKDILSLADELLYKAKLNRNSVETNAQ